MELTFKQPPKKVLTVTMPGDDPERGRDGSQWQLTLAPRTFGELKAAEKKEYKSLDDIVSFLKTMVVKLDMKKVNALSLDELVQLGKSLGELSVKEDARSEPEKKRRGGKRSKSSGS